VPTRPEAGAVVPPDDAALEPGSAARITDLFDRIRREAAADEAHGEAAARVALVSGGQGEPPDDGPLSVADELGRVLSELDRAVGRGVKRELTDEQNELLDAVRRSRSTPSLDDVLPPTEQHVDRLVNAAASALSDAAVAGGLSLPAEVRAGGEPPRVGALAHDVAAELAAELVAPLRAQLARAFAASEDDEAASEAVRTVYREWRGQRVDRAAGDAVAVAFNRGVLATVVPGTRVRWLATQTIGGCPTCAANAAADGVVAGEPFPSGHEAPPCHDDCRCVLVAIRGEGPAGAADRSPE
jgi:hypothetical protein